MNGQITASATRLVARGRDINIVHAPIHPPQKAERTVEEKRGGERNVKWLRAEEIERKGNPLDLRYTSEVIWKKGVLFGITFHYMIFWADYPYIKLISNGNIEVSNNFCCCWVDTK